jgi:thiol peroxidase
VSSEFPALPESERVRLCAREENDATSVVGAITSEGRGLSLRGPLLDVGAGAPAFSLVSTEGATHGASLPKLLRFEDYASRWLLLSVVPSIDTPVCEAQTGHLLSMTKDLPDNGMLITVSRDLPFAQRRFRESVGDQGTFGSDARDRTLGRGFGVEVVETGLLARSVWLISPEGRVRYRQIVKEQTKEPDYEALAQALASARAARDNESP